MRLVPVALALVLALALTPLWGSGHAQTPEPAPQLETCRAPVLAVERPARAFEAGGSTALLMSIENENGPPVDSVRATLTTTAPPGWTAIPAQRELTMAPSNVTITTLSVTSPNRGSGAGEGNITIFVSFLCTTGEFQRISSANQTIEVSIASFQPPWPLVLTAFSVLAAGVTVLGVRRLRRGIALTTLGDERDVAPGRSVKFTFHIENRRGRPQRLRLDTTGVPAGWAMHLALTDIELEPGEEKTLWAILKAPFHAAPGETVTVGLRLTQAEREIAAAALHARVTGT